MSTRQHLVRLLILMTVFVFGNTPVVSAQFSEAGVDKFRVAVEAPDFTLKELGGGERSLKAMRGKIAILNFFATW